MPSIEGRVNGSGYLEFTTGPARTMTMWNVLHSGVPQTLVPFIIQMVMRYANTENVEHVVRAMAMCWENTMPRLRVDTIQTRAQLRNAAASSV